MRRLRTGLEIINRYHPGCVVSVDTFRADVARMCVEEYGVAILSLIHISTFTLRLLTENTYPNAIHAQHDMEKKPMDAEAVSYTHLGDTCFTANSKSCTNIWKIASLLVDL